MIDISTISKWSPKNKWLEIKTIDAHTEGEPLRIVISGIPFLKGETVLEKRNHMMKKFDHVRKAIMLEPRGHADMYGAIIVEPDKNKSDFGVIFMHNEGYSTGCGHAVIAISKVLVETGVIKLNEPETEINMDVPSGTIKAFVKSKNKKVDEIIYMSPDGEKLNQKTSNSLSLRENIVILCGHYKGIDERVRKHLITKEISIGDYVLTGGELPAAILIDSVIRLIPGVVSNESAALSDSFQDNLLGHPNYTRPAEFNGWKVPEILLSGNQKEIDEWRIKTSYQKTKRKRPDLLN